MIKMLLGDEAVVNCVQCHPFDCVVATSGIDSTIKIWTPSASVPSIVAGGAAGPEISNVLEAMESNQRRLCHNREAILYDYESMVVHRIYILFCELCFATLRSPLNVKSMSLFNVNRNWI